MARPQSFERDAVLHQALDVFWHKGYDGASVQDLVDATGLNRGSLYNSFGDKADLFAEVMAVYRSQSPTNILSNAPHNASIPKLFHDFFMSLVDRAKADADHKGCLMTNTAAGFYGCSDAMTDWVCESFANLESLFVSLIKRGQARGEIPLSIEPVKLARYFVSSAQGMNVTARMGASPEVLYDIAEQCLECLEAR